MKTPQRLIAMVQPNPGPESKDGRLHSIGCAGRLTQFSETEDGRYMITLTGISRFRIKREVDGFSAYRRCDVDWSGFDRDLGHAEHDAGLDRAQFMTLLNRFFEARSLEADWETMRDADEELLINSLSMLLDLSPEDKQALLEAPSLATRRETLVTLIEFALRGGASEDLMQ